MTYTIKPLEWKSRLEPDWEFWTAYTTFGSYRVERDGKSVTWKYCFDDYYDEDEFRCDSVEEGKRLAEEHWQKRLSYTLLPVGTSKGTP